MPFAILVRPQSAIYRHPRDQLFQHLLGIYRPPGIFLYAAVPCPVEPKVLYAWIAGSQFFQLIVHESEKTAESDAVLPTSDVIPPVGMTPVHDRKIEMNIHSLLPAGLHQFDQDILPIRRTGYVVWTIFARPQAKAFVLFCRDLDVPESGSLKPSHPFLRIKLFRIPLFHQFQPFIRRYLCPGFQPFCLSWIDLTLHRVAPYFSGISSPFSCPQAIPQDHADKATIITIKSPVFQSRCRFIHDNNFRVAHDGLSDTQTPLHSARQSVGPAVTNLVQPYLPQ